jgi:hypothetical protein
VWDERVAIGDLGLLVVLDEEVSLRWPRNNGHRD